VRYQVYRGACGRAIGPMFACGKCTSCIDKCQVKTSLLSYNILLSYNNEPLQTMRTSPRNYLKIHQREIRINTRNTDAAAFTLFRFVPRE
jgi:hypothetical protein